MRFCLVLAFIVSLTAASAAQTIGANTFIFKAPNEFSFSYGFGAGFEYSYHLSKNFDLAVEPAFLYHSNNSGSLKTNYLHIPVLAGIRLYIFDYFFKPYISLSAIGSYFRSDQLRETLVSSYITSFGPAFQYRLDVVPVSSFNVGANLTFGTMLKITDKWSINLAMGASIISERYADFSGYKLGAAFNY